MNKTKFQEWLDNLGDAWVKKDPQEVLNLLSEEIEYYENVLEKPFVGKKEVYKLWKDVPNTQKDIMFTGKVLFKKGNTAIANWNATFIKLTDNKKYLIDGIFFFELDETSKCTLFKQWETIRTS